MNMSVVCVKFMHILVIHRFYLYLFLSLTFALCFFLFYFFSVSMPMSLSLFSPLLSLPPFLPLSLSIISRSLSSFLLALYRLVSIVLGNINSQCQRKMTVGDAATVARGDRSRFARATIVLYFTRWCFQFPRVVVD